MNKLGNGEKKRVEMWVGSEACLVDGLDHHGEHPGVVQVQECCRHEIIEARGYAQMNAATRRANRFGKEA